MLIIFQDPPGTYRPEESIPVDGYTQLPRKSVGSEGFYNRIKSKISRKGNEGLEQIGNKPIRHVSRGKIQKKIQVVL